MTPEEIAELITRRRRQLLVHSIIYYCMNDNIITDNQWAKWAIELEDLQRDYPEIAKNCPRAKEFENFDHSTGYNLPLNDPYAVATARRLLDMKYKKKYNDLLSDCVDHANKSTANLFNAIMSGAFATKE